MPCEGFCLNFLVGAPNVQCQLNLSSSCANSPVYMCTVQTVVQTFISEIINGRQCISYIFSYSCYNKEFLSFKLAKPTLLREQSSNLCLFLFTCCIQMWEFVMLL